jgi:hypothetical protein
MLLRAGIAATIPLALALLVSFGPAKRRALACLLLAADYLAVLPDDVALGRPVADLRTPLGAVLGPEDILCNQSAAELVVRTSSDRWYKALPDESLRVNLAVDLQACDGVKSPFLYSPLQPSANERLSAGPSTELTARILGCTAMVALNPPPDASGPPLQIEGYARDGEPGARIHRVKDPLPPAFIARGARLRATEDDAVRAVLESSNLESALAVADDPLDRGPFAATLPSGDRATIAAVEWKGPEKARVVLAGPAAPSSEDGAVVAIRTSYRAGWHAHPEGDPAELPIVRIAGTHLAAVVNDTSRPIIFEYRPPYAWFGIAAAIAGLITAFVSSNRRR